MSAPKHVVVVGNTPAAWICAVFLKRRLQLAVTIVAPPINNNTTQVALSETFTPDLLKLHKLCGLFEHQWLIPCRGCFQTGMRVLGKNSSGAEIDAILPFSKIGADLDGIDFHHYANKLNITDFESYSLASTMARAGRFIHPVNDDSSILSSFDYGTAIDTHVYTSIMVNYAQHLGVNVVSVDELRANCVLGKVNSIIDNHNQAIEADLFIDASEGLALRRQQDKTHAENELGDISLTSADFAEHQFTSRMAATSRQQGEPHAYKTVANTPYGILVSNTLNDGIYYQLYYDNNMHSPEQIEQYLTDYAADSAMPLNFKNECIEQSTKRDPWRENCVVITGGLSVQAPILMGDLETAIRAVNRLIDIFPVNSDMANNATEFNRLHVDFCARLFEYQQTFYCLIKPLSQDKKQVAHCSEQAKPHPKVEYKLSLFKQSGMLAVFENDPIPKTLWINLFLISGHLPETHHTLLDMREMLKSTKQIASIKALVNSNVHRLPTISQYWQQLLARHVNND